MHPQGKKQPREQKHGIRGVTADLHGIKREDIPVEDKVNKLLEVGREHIGAEIGYLTMIDQTIDQTIDRLEVMVSTCSRDGEIPVGVESDLQETYCSKTIDESAQVALDDTRNQEILDIESEHTHDIRSYLGTPVRIGGEQYGTVCFVSSEPREQPYSSEERLIGELVTQMIESELVVEQYEQKLTQQQNLTVVLNRVLRHNLRNDMSVIRGYTRMMAEELESPDVGEKALQSIDGLIQLSEKARELDEILAADEKRKQADIASVVESVADSVAQEYPSASVSVETKGNPTTQVFPSFRHAVEELVENAAKHGGETPSVNISVQTVPNAVEIRIEDDGPGIDQQEQEVLDENTETPLMHGSGLGLWLSNWVLLQHDGTIEATTTPDGTRVTVTVPRTPVVDVDRQVGEIVRTIDQYKAAFDEAGDGMIIVDDDARIIDANEKAGEIYQATTGELLGESLSSFIPDDYDFEAEWSKVMESDTVRDEMYILGVKGVSRIVEYTAETDVVSGQHLIIARDITEQVEREQTLERFKAAVENAGHAILFTDENGTIEYVNDAFEQITGYTKDEAIGRNPSILNSGEMGESYFEEQWDAITSGRMWEEQIINQRKNGDKYTALQTIAPITNNNDIEGYVAVQSDVGEFSNNQ